MLKACQCSHIRNPIRSLRSIRHFRLHFRILSPLPILHHSFTSVLFRFSLPIVHLGASVMANPTFIPLLPFRRGIVSPRAATVPLWSTRFWLTRFWLTRFGLTRFGLTRFGLTRFRLACIGLMCAGLMCAAPRVSRADDNFREFPDVVSPAELFRRLLEMQHLPPELLEQARADVG